MTKRRLMFTSLLFFFFISGSAQAQVGCRGPCEAISADNLRDISQVSTLLEGIGFSDLNRSIIKESLSPESQAQVPVQVQKKWDDGKAIFDVNHTSDDSAAVFFVFRAPPAFSMRSEGRNQITIDSVATNTQIQGAILPKKGPIGEFRSHIVDTVSQTTRAQIELGDRQNEISISVRMYEMMGKPDLIFYPVSDSFIEDFHSKIGAHDPYKRRAQGMDRVVVDLRDTEGRQFKAKDGQTFILPVIIKKGVFQTLQESASSRTTLNSGLQGQVPVSRTFSQAGLGAYSNIAHHHQISEQSFLSFATGVGLNIQKALSNSSYSPFDDKAHISMNASIGVAYTCVDPQDKSKQSIVVSGSIESPILRDKDYREIRASRFIDQQSSDAVRKSDMAFGIHYVYESKDNVFSVGCLEDFGNYRDRRGRRVMDGRNNRDFSCSVKMGKRF
jgi:hypothetical protein